MKNASQALWGVVLCGLAMVGLSTHAQAQTSFGALVVNTCGTPLTTYVPGKLGVITMDTTGKLCDTGSGGGGGGGLSVVDQTAFVQGTSAFTPSGGVFNDTATLSSGQEGTYRLTTKRAQIVDTDTSGNALYSAITAPVPALAATTSTTNSYSTGVTVPLNSDLNGNLYVNAKIAGNTPVIGPTPDGTAASTNPVLVAGTTDGTGTGAVAVPKVSAGGLVSVDGSAVTQPVSGTVTNNNAVNVTLNDCSGTVVTGGTAVNAFTAQTTLHGFTIFNYDTAHNDEVLWISFTTTAAALTAGSYPVPAPTATSFAGGGSFTSPPGMGSNHALSVVAATSGHAFSCTWW